MRNIRRYPLVLAACCLVIGLSPTAVDAAEQKLTNVQLAEKARRLQRLVEDRMLQAHGMIPMLVRASDYKLPTAEDYKGAYRHRHLRGKTEAEIGIPPMHVWRAWENTSTNTAFYLRAMAYQYCVTGDPQVLAICRRTFAALKYIYTLPIAKGEKGFLCKPYGGQYSNQGGRDQLQCVTWGLMAYRSIAPPPDLADLDMMTRDFADFALKVPNVSPHGYFGRTAEEYGNQWRSDAWDRAISFLPLLYLAWQGTGDDRHAAEIQRWYDDCANDKSLVFATDKFSSSGFGGKRNLYLPSFLMEVKPSHRDLWRRTMLSLYQQGRTGLLADGTWPAFWTYDSETGQMASKENQQYSFTHARTGRSSLFAHACVAAQRWFPEVDMAGDARHILENLDEHTFRFVMPLDDKHPLPPEWVVESKMLDGDSLTGWLCAYWEGRYRGYWK